MAQIKIHLAARDDGSILVTASDAASWSHVAEANAVRELKARVAELTANFDSGHRPLADPVTLNEIGSQLRDVFLAPFASELSTMTIQEPFRLLFTSTESACLNLLWELLPSADGQFLVADARCTIRRTTRLSLPAGSLRLAAPPLRILFVACAPTNLVGLDHEREEEAILWIAHRLGSSVHLDIAEAGTFDELRNLISEYQPHIVHLSGHGSVSEGIGYFAFENERGQHDSRDGREIAQQLFAGRGVGLVFINGCQSAQSATSGLCQTLTSTGHVPLALGWGASIADDRATEFARVLLHEIAAGQAIDLAVATARRDLLAQCRFREGPVELLDASFALPQLYAADMTDELIDRALPPVRPARPGVRYELLGDNIRGLREGFVGRRRLLQRTRPALRTGEKTVLLLTGIGGAGKSTLTTRIANRSARDGFGIVALQARRDEAQQFCLKLLSELGNACLLRGQEHFERVLRDGNRSIADRLRFAVDVLNQTKTLLVLDNLETLMPPPPAPPEWEVPDFGIFFRNLTSRLTGEGRAILTCRYRPEDFDSALPNLAYEPMPDFTEGDFFKYLRRHEKVAARMRPDELSRNLLEAFYRKLGATPRFIEQATAVLAQIEPDTLRDQLEGVTEGETDELQQKYFRDLFLPQLYDALPRPIGLALSRLAVVDVPLPADGVARVAGLSDADAMEAIDRWIGLGLTQRFGEADETPLYAVYPLQRDFLVDGGRLPPKELVSAQQNAAAFFQDAYHQNREQALRLPVHVELLSCLQHASAVGDRDRQRWAAVKLARALEQRAEFRSALDLLGPLLITDQHYEVLMASASALKSLGKWKQARKYFQDALTALESTGDRFNEGLVWHELGTLDVSEGNLAAARQNFGKALVIEQAAGNRRGEAATLNNLSSIDRQEGNYASAREMLNKSLAIKQAIGDHAGEAASWHNLATLDIQGRDYTSARENLGKTLSILKLTNDRIGEAATWHSLATVDLLEGNFGAARLNFGKALAVRQAIGDQPGEGSTWHQLGTLDLDEGNYAAARDNFSKALRIKQEIGDRAGEAATRHQLATIDLREGKFGPARENFGKALALMHAIGDRAGEAATLYQIGFLAWSNGRHAIGIRLVAMCFSIESAISSAEAKETFEKGLRPMAEAFNLNEEMKQSLLAATADEYEKNHGAELVRQAFEGL